MVKVSASLLSCRDNLDNIISEYNKLDIDLIHLDIMDGLFVPNTSFNDYEIDKIFNNVNKDIDVHLMVNDPINYIDLYNKPNVKYITFHYEVFDSNVFKKIRSIGKKVGISINPSTPVSDIVNILPFVDLVLIMSVNPGKGGQSFIPSSIDKIKDIKEYIDGYKLDALIEVDGGVNLDTYKSCVDNGADILVIGSALEKSNDRDKFIDSVKSYE